MGFTNVSWVSVIFSTSRLIPVVNVRCVLLPKLDHFNVVNLHSHRFNATNRLTAIVGHTSMPVSFFLCFS